MASWYQFKTEAKKLLTDVSATDDLFAAACASYVQCAIAKDFDRDIPRAKSHENDFDEYKKRLLGFTTTLAVGSTLDVAVKKYLTDVTATDELFATAISEYVQASFAATANDAEATKLHQSLYEEWKRRLVGYQTTQTLGSTLDTAVRVMLTDVDANDDLFASACAAYVKAMIAREVDHDLELFKSYYTNYADLRRRLLGFNTTLSVGSTLDVAVKLLLPVDADREGIQNFLTQLIKNAYRDVKTFGTIVTDQITEGYRDLVSYGVYLTQQIKNAANELQSLSVWIDKTFREVAIDLQAYIECYRFGEETVFTSSDVASMGNFSRGAMPDQGEIVQAFWLEDIPALAENVAYNPGDFVSSNGRTYEVLRSGTLTTGQLGSGLLTTDGSIETLGGMMFTFYYGEACLRSDIVVMPFYDRYQWNRLRTGCGSRNTPAMLAIDPQAYSFYVWPKLDSSHRISIFWSSVAFDVSDGDPVPLDESAQVAAKEYVLAKYAEQFEGDGRAAQQHEAAYASIRARLYVDCRTRQSVIPK